MKRVVASICMLQLGSATLPVWLCLTATEPAVVSSVRLSMRPALQRHECPPNAQSCVAVLSCSQGQLCRWHMVRGKVRPIDCEGQQQNGLCLQNMQPSYHMQSWDAKGQQWKSSAQSPEQRRC